jgi:hypothetical protein
LVRRFTEEEINFIKENYSKMTGLEIAKKLGRSRGSVLSKTWILGLSKRGRRVWKDSEIEFVKENYPDKSVKQIAEILGRTNKSVHYMIQRLGVSRFSRSSIVDARELQLPPLELGRVAGLIDGEGGAYLTKANREEGLGRWVPLVQVANTNRMLLNHLRKITKIGSVYRASTREGCKQGFVWRVKKVKDLYSLLLTVEPYLIIKKKQARLAMKALEVKDDSNLSSKDEKLRELEKIYRIMRRLND